MYKLQGEQSAFKRQYVYILKTKTLNDIWYKFFYI